MKKYSFVMIALMSTTVAFADMYQVVSPDGRIQVQVNVDKNITYSVIFKGQQVISASPLSMKLADGVVLGAEPEPRLLKALEMTIEETIKAVVPCKSKSIDNKSNQLSLVFDCGYELVFRAYDDGVAYRFVTHMQKQIEVLSEQVQFNFAADHFVYFPTEESFLTHSERYYEYLPLSKIDSDKMCSLPALVDIKNGPKVAITEVDLADYPGLYLRGSSSMTLSGLFPAVATKEKQHNDRTVSVVERADYIAKTNGTRSFPWRVLVIAEKDADLITSQITYKLAAPLVIDDPSWIRPGKVAWDWWNFNNIYGVDFEAGVNTQTYKYYIDFASKYGIEYIILDEGWYVLGDLLNVKPQMDIEELVRYGKEKNVGIILWVVWKTLEDQLEGALDQFAKWDVKGIKVDFMQRDDQWMVNYYHKIAKEAAKRHLLVDFHGSYKPTGLRRAYPNVITREGVVGLEQYKWKSKLNPEHEVTIPFIRMLAGPMDYTPGAMVNAQKDNFRFIFRQPMSKGTRCRQLAMYVVYESPLQMLADSPSNYLKEPQCMEFLSKVPTVWEQTIVLDAKVADYVLIARKSGSDWYIGALTDDTPRELVVDFAFLDQQEYTATIYADGINAHRYGSDYRQVVDKVNNKTVMNIRLAPGGGWAAMLAPSEQR